MRRFATIACCRPRWKLNQRRNLPIKPLRRSCGAAHLRIGNRVPPTARRRAHAIAKRQSLPFKEPDRRAGWAFNRIADSASDVQAAIQSRPLRFSSLSPQAAESCFAHAGHFGAEATASAWSSDSVSRRLRSKGHAEDIYRQNFPAKVAKPLSRRVKFLAGGHSQAFIPRVPSACPSRGGRRQAMLRVRALLSFGRYRSSSGKFVSACCGKTPHHAGRRARCDGQTRKVRRGPGQGQFDLQHSRMLAGRARIATAVSDKEISSGHPCPILQDRRQKS
jgi:hypothetical protein